ncbi:MAG: hydroxyisourate hydrolase [Bryobacteraceae bacterium]
MITTQVTDSSRGVAAAHVPVDLDFFISGHGWRAVGQGNTDGAGFIRDFGEPPVAGIYRLAFDVAQYAPDSMFPTITITFEVRDPGAGCHLPLVLTAYGYSTYRTSSIA